MPLMNKLRKLPSLGVSLIFLLTFVAYFPAIRGGFIWDDDVLITANPMMKSRDGLYRFWFTTETMDYWPVTSTAWWLEWRLWGDRTTGYHVINVLLHIVNAVLIWIVLRQLKVPGAWMAAVVFALHPVNVATVAWISEQKNMLAMLFYLISIFLYLRFDEDSRWRFYIFSLAAFLLALLSKAAVVMLPVVLLGCVWWRRDKIQWRDILHSLPFFVLSLVLGLVTVWFQHNQSVQAQLEQKSGLFSRWAAAGWMPWFYLYKTLLPVGLNVIYPDWQIDTSHWVSFMPGLLLMGCFVLFWLKRGAWGRPLLFGLGYFVVTLFPVLGFFRQSFHRFSLVADHWQYFSIIGVIALVVAGAEKIFRCLGQRTRYWTAAAGVAVLATLGVATWTRAAVYRDAETLWRDTVAKNPKAWAGFNNLGLILLQTGRAGEAIGNLQRALQLKPNYADAHYNLGIAFAQTDRIEDAINQYEQALRLAPDSAETHNNLGIALKQMGRLDDAISHFEQAVRIAPNDAEVHYNLATTLRQVGKNNEAIVHFEQAVHLKPDFVGAHYNLGAALVKAGRMEEGIQHFEQALRLKPDYNEHNKLGIALMQVGKIPDAIRHFEEALRLNPNLPEVHYNLAAALERTGKFSEAIGEYEQAMRLKPDFAEAQRGWARLQSAR